MQRRFSDRTLINRLKLRHLAFLVLIDEERSISKAAGVSDISQPAATKLLREIEELVGARLFERTRHKVEPTAPGALVLAAARRILSEVRRLGEELSALGGGEAGRVAIGSLISASSTLVPLSLGRLAERCPQVTTSIMETTEDVLLPALLVGDLDLVLGRLPERLDPRLDMRTLYVERFCIVTRPGHPILAPDADLGAALGRASWVLPPPKTMTRVEVEQTLIRHGLGPPRVVAESSAVMVNLRLVQSSDSLSAMPMTLATVHARLGGLAMLRGGPVFPESRIGLIACAGRDQTPAARQFTAAVEEVAAELQAAAPAA